MLIWNQIQAMYNRSASQIGAANLLVNGQRMTATIRSLPGALAPGDLRQIAIRERRLVTFTLHGLGREDV